MDETLLNVQEVCYGPRQCDRGHSLRPRTRRSARFAPAWEAELNAQATAGPEHFARVRPDAVALVEGERSLTWAAWNDRADRLAAALAARGFGADSRIGVALRPRIEWFVVNAALAKLGAIQVAMNLRLTPAELAYIAEDSGIRAAFLDVREPGPVQDALTALGARTVAHVDSGGGALTLDALIGEHADPERRVAASQAQLIVYTSGTTGRPKGAFRRTPTADPDILSCYLDATRFDDHSHGDDRRALLNMPMHHAAGPNHANACLSHGGIAVLQRRFDAEDTLRLIERHGITHWHAVPTMLQRIFALPAEVRAGYDVSALRSLSVGAAPVPYALKERVFDYFGEGLLYEGYGCTEASMIAGMRPDEHRRKPGAAGRPFRHVAVRIVGADGAVLPAGETGEIHVRTPRMIPGYLGKGPLGPDVLDAGGHFRTGDLGHLDEDGYLYVTGRSTDMIIAAGVNIYPAEIEDALRAHPAVADVAVIGVPDADLGERVHAVVERAPGATATGADLVAFTEGRIAAYKRPRTVELVDGLPRNAMGKVLKRRLREERAS
ncbi:long-chain fatty acid--CoA ligase [Actinomadura darangshiensis]|uniref:Long-chain fatty acid--CoA ligase n=2 Tax=Actinomadura darangshiensis TaxID=705336 RepID=A0A4R5C275_9ACTN|nr:AMP-binding protein [Actinomadura darangshiensis]TDD92133.1 long-chain fatty acid--CoA ligase [Actinomadura darangshiensis]